MTIFMVTVNGDTGGTIDTDTLDGQHPDSFMGERVTIHAHDENGNPVDHTGLLTSVDDDGLEPWQ